MKKTPLAPMAVQAQLRVYAENLRAARLRRGLSVARLAEKAGLSPRTLHRIEAGEPGVAFATVVNVLWAMDLLPSIADPKSDEEALRIELARTRKTSRRHRELLRDL
jgi:transcriptional regulator with XRE-family HTH domain